MLTLEEKIELIENSKNIDELTLDVIPPTYSENYYFVSYSHKDYKKVFKEILLLQSKGISLWYDRGMRPGKDWKEIAETMIDKYACKGVIFFVSENLVTSKSCAEEMEYVNKTGKNFCSINLAASDNNIYSAAELCEMINIPLESKKIITSIFPPSVLYLNETDPIDKKVEGLLKLKEPQLLSYTFYKQSKEERFEEIISNKYDDEEWLFAQEVNNLEDDLPFMNKNNFHYASITFSYNQDVKLLKIPSFVYCNFEGNLYDEVTNDSIINKVTIIGRCCFANYIRLTNVIMEDSIEKIEESAFQGCTHLETFKISPRVHKINDYTFYNCKNLCEIDLSSIEKIGENAFYNCESLESIVLSKDVKELKLKAFYGCHNLENIQGVFNVKTIPTYCFYKCEKLKNITFSNILSLINTSAFEGCKSLETFSFTENIETIEPNAFKNCTSLTKLDFNDNLKIICGNAFCGCENIKEIYFGKKLSEIYYGSFKGCVNLTEVILPKKIKCIGRAAFSDCTNLKKIIIPKKCKHLGEMLSNNPNLTEIIYEGTLEEWSKVKGFDHLFIEEYPFMLSNEEIDLDTIDEENNVAEHNTITSNRKYYEVICTDGIYKNIK